MEKKQANKGITEVKHFKMDYHLRIICYTSEEGLGAVLPQQQVNDWETTHFAPKFLTEFEKTFSKNELELLVVVWAKKIPKLCILCRILGRVRSQGFDNNF